MFGVWNKRASVKKFIDNILELVSERGGRRRRRRRRHLIRGMGVVGGKNLEEETSWGREKGRREGYDMASGDNLWHTKNIALRHSNVPPPGGVYVGVLSLLLQ